MLEIKITGSTPLEALASITAFGLHCYNDPAVSAAANRILEAEADKPAAPAPVAAPVAPAPVAAPVAPPVAAVPVAAAPSYTTAELGTAGANLVAEQPAKMNELRMLLAQFGVNAVTELKAEQIGAFATALRGLGAKI